MYCSNIIFESGVFSVGFIAAGSKLIIEDFSPEKLYKDTRLASDRESIGIVSAAVPESCYDRPLELSDKDWDWALK